MIGKKLLWAAFLVALAIGSVIAIVGLDLAFITGQMEYVVVFGVFAIVLALLMIINIRKNGEY